MLYTLEQVDVLLDNKINYISEFILKVIDNEVHTYKDVIRQPDRNDFIEVMKKETNNYERRDH